MPITHHDLAQLIVTKLPFSRAGWVFELKYDGFRVLAARRAGVVELRSRRGTDLLPCFPEIGRCLEALPELVLDGELVMLDEIGRPVFGALLRRLALKRRISVDHASRTTPAAVFAFDLLELEGKDLRKQPLLKRKAALQKVLRGSERIRYLQHVGEEGERLFKMAAGLGLEGIVAKQADRPYYAGRSSGWLKVKTATGRAMDAERRKWNDQPGG